jgi:hypothetical protein
MMVYALNLACTNAIEVVPGCLCIANGKGCLFPHAGLSVLA